MKKLALLLVFAVVVVFSVPALAQNPFADVPADHWAYDAVTQAVAGGIITGFPDGTYKGAQNLTRYEVAMIIARILDSIEKERTSILREVDKQDAVLSTSVEAMEAMLEADIKALAQRLDVEVETVKKAITVDVDGLKADLTSYIDALEARLGTKITGVEGALGSKVDALDSKFDAVFEDIIAELDDLDFWIDILYENVHYVDTRVDEVAADVAAVNTKIADVSSDVSAMDGKVAKAVADVSAVDAKVVTVAAEVKEVGAQISALKAGMDAVYGDLDAYFEYLQDVEFWVDILYNEMDYVNSRLEEVAEKIAAVDAKVDGVVADMNKKIKDLATQVADVDFKIDVLDADVKMQMAELSADFDSKLKEVAAQVAAAKEAAAKAHAVDAKVEDLAADVDAGFAKVAGDIAAIHSKMDALAAEVAKQLAGLSADLVDEVAADVDAVKAKLEAMAADVENRFASFGLDVDAKMDTLADDLYAKIREVSAGVDAVDTKVDILGDKVDDVDAKVGALEARAADLAIQLGEVEKEILDRIAKTQRELSAAQATQVVAIVERMLDRYEPDFPEPDITKVEVEEMIKGLAALLEEFQEEISVLPRFDKELGIIATELMLQAKKIEGVDERLKAVEDRLAVVDFKARTAINFEATRVAGDRVAVAKPAAVFNDAANTPYVRAADLVFYDDLNGKKEVKDKDVFEQTLNMDMKFQKGVVEADFKISGKADYRTLETDLIGIDIGTLEGVITTPDMTATIKDGQKVHFKDYLLNSATLDGIVVVADKNVYTLAKYEQVTAAKWDEYKDAAGKKHEVWNPWKLDVKYIDGAGVVQKASATFLFSPGFAEAQALAGAGNVVLEYEVTAPTRSGTAEVKAKRNVFAAKYTDLELFTRDFNLYYALGGVGDGDRAVVALDHSFELAGFDIAADVGLSTQVGDFGMDGRLIRFIGEREIATVDLTLHLELTEDFASILGKHKATKQGFGLLAEREIWLLDANARFSVFDYGTSNETKIGFGVELAKDKLTLAGFGITGLFDFETETVAGENRIEFKTAANRELGPVDLTLSFYFLDDQYKGDEELELKLLALYPDLFGMIDASAELVLIEDFSLTLKGKYVALPITAGLTLEIADDTNIILEGRYNQPAFAQYAGLDIGLNAGARFHSDKGLNLDAGVVGRKAITERLDFVGSLNLAILADADLPGTRFKRALGLTYAVSEAADAKVTYEITNINHDGGDYTARTLKAGVSLSF